MGAGASLLDEDDYQHFLQLDDYQLQQYWLRRVPKNELPDLIERATYLSDAQRMNFLHMIRESSSRAGCRSRELLRIKQKSSDRLPDESTSTTTLLLSNSQIESQEEDQAQQEQQDLKSIVNSQRMQYTGVLVELRMIDVGIDFFLADLGEIFQGQIKRVNLSKNRSLSGNILAFKQAFSLHELCLEDTACHGGKCRPFSILMHENVYNALYSRCEIYFPNKDLKALAACTKLIKLFLSSLNITGDISIFSEFRGLKKVWLRETDCYGYIGCFQACPILVDCLLRDTLVTGDINVFENKPKLQQVSLSKTGVSGDILSFRSCTSLTLCALEFCDGITGEREDLEDCLPRCQISL